jgi:hypothetical protein
MSKELRVDEHGSTGTLVKGKFVTWDELDAQKKSESGEADASSGSTSDLQAENERLKAELEALKRQSGANPEDQAEANTGTGTALPEGFPGKAALEKAGFTTLESVRAASDEDLISVENIGDATFQKIREAQKGA